MASITQRELRITFTLSNGSTFAGAPQQSNNTLQLSQLRASAKIVSAGAPAFPTCELTIWGMRQSDMNALSALTLQVTGITRNTVQVEANTGIGGAWSTVFAGQISSANIDYSARPDVTLKVYGQYLYFDMLNPALPTSYTTGTPISTIVSTLAGKLGCAFENNGVNATLDAPYFPGTLVQQLRAAINKAGVDMYIVPGLGQANADQNNPTAGQTIAICNKGAMRQRIPSFNLSAASGLVSNPVPDSRGYLNVKALYNPAFHFGGPLTISGSYVVIDQLSGSTNGKIGQTLLNAQANGNWMIGQLRHALESRKYGGEWFSYMLLYPPGTEPPQQ
jgi:hypothetical protein